MTSLVPVSEWVYHRFRITYWYDDEQTRPYHRMATVVETNDHVGTEVDRHWPSQQIACASWEPIEENVPNPCVRVGTLHGMPIHENYSWKWE